MTSSTKLTLRLDSGLIDSAKAFAKKQDRSLSQLVADYFVRLDTPSAPPGRAKRNGTAPNMVRTLGPVTTSLRGVLATSGSKAKPQRPAKPLGMAAYHAYLEEKHK